MRLFLYILLGIIISFIIISVVAYTIPSTDDLSPYNPLWNGLSRLVSDFGGRVITLKDIKLIYPPRSIILVIGFDKNISEEDLSYVKSYVLRGGVLVIADEREEVNKFLESLDISASVSGEIVADYVFMYRNPLLPIAFAKISGDNLSIYLNYASYINISRPGEGVCVAYTSLYSFIDKDLSGSRETSEPYGPFCVVYLVRIGDGYVYLISDSSVFINSMINLGDNERFIKYLVDGRDLYILYEPVSVSVYSIFRGYIISFYAMILGTWLRYPAALIVALTLYTLGVRYRDAWRFRREKIIFSDLPDIFKRDFEKLIKDLEKRGEEK